MMTDPVVVAFHEAGHAWAYWRANLPVRYATIRAAGGGGIVRPRAPRKIDIGTQAFTAAAGPIAEALHLMRAEPDADLYEWGDFVAGAVLDGGHSDLEIAGDLIDDESLRDEIDSDWRRVALLAERLVSLGTVSGAVAFDLLSSGKREIR